jgi:Ferritin-like domain
VVNAGAGGAVRLVPLPTDIAGRGEPTSRRALLRSAIAGAGAALLTGCGRVNPQNQRVKKAGSVPPADIPLLQGLLDLELMMIAAYTAGTPLLDPYAAKAARQFLLQELAHAGELSGLVRGAHVKPHEAKQYYNLGHPQTSLQVVQLLHRIESALIAAYLSTIPRLQSPLIRGAVSTILANDAQHVSVLRMALGGEPVPSALVSGRE